MKLKYINIHGIFCVVDEEVEHIDVTVLEHKMADDTAIIRWSQSDLLGYIIKSIGDPTKAMFGDSTAILVGTLENTTGRCTR